MGVRINLSKTFKMPVNFTVLNAEGKPENWSFIAEFKRLTHDEVKVVIDGVDDDIAKLTQVLVGWKMTIIDTGEDVPFSAESFAEFCSQPKVAGNTFLQFLEKVGGNRAKN